MSVEPLRPQPRPQTCQPSIMFLNDRNFFILRVKIGWDSTEDVAAYATQILHPFMELWLLVSIKGFEKTSYKTRIWLSQIVKTWRSAVISRVVKLQNA